MRYERNLGSHTDVFGREARLAGGRATAPSMASGVDDCLAQTADIRGVIALRIKARMAVSTSRLVVCGAIRSHHPIPPRSLLEALIAEPYRLMDVTT